MLSRRIQRLVHGVSAPNLVIAQRVIDRMATAANEYLQDETGEAMVGLVMPPPLPNGVGTLYVLDTISPDESAVRHFHTFQQGDARQDELIWWLQENWRIGREKAASGGLARLWGGNPKKWDAPLRYLGDWHKQPGYMIHPSGGDLMTAIQWIEDRENNTDFLLAPIVTLDHPTTIEMPDATTNFLLIPQDDGGGLRIDFWYIDDRIGMFIPIIPAVYPNDQLPTLVEYPWHLTNEELLDNELLALHEDGLYVSSTLTLWDADGAPPLEICLLAGRMGSDKLLIVVTPHNYPQGAPRIRVAPFMQMNPNDDPYRLFERIWASSTPLDLPYDRAKHLRLLDYVLAAEAKLGIEHTAPAKPETIEPVKVETVQPPPTDAVETDDESDDEPETEEA